MEYKDKKDEMSQPKVSVIVPVYNVEKYLERCVQSLFNQTLKEIEIILVDDGSLDKSSQMCDEYAQQDERVKIIHKKNEGLGFARNSGLAVAKGEFVAFVDSDDFVELKMYEDLYVLGIKEQADVVLSNAIFNHDGRTSIRMDVEKSIVFRGRKAVDDFLLDYVAPLPEYNKDVKYMMSVWRGLYSRELIERNSIRFLSERDVVSEDIPFNLDVFMNAQCVVYSDKAYYNYCYNGNSLSHTCSFDKYDKMPEFCRAVKARLKSKYDEEYYILHFQRMVLMLLRGTLNNEISICKKQGLSYRNRLDKKYNESVYANVLATYPFYRMPFKFRLCYLLLKHRKEILYYWISKILGK